MDGSKDVVDTLVKSKEYSAARLYNVVKVTELKDLSHNMSNLNILLPNFNRVLFNKTLSTTS